MPSQSSTREKLLLEGVKAMLAHGYEGVGIGPLLAAAGVPKGSFYHFFASKDDFALAVLEAYSEHYRILREELFADVSQSPLDRLDAYHAELEREVVANHPHGGCLLGVFAQTVGGRSAEMRRRLGFFYERWERSVEALLAEAKAIGEIDPGIDAAEAAADLIDAYEGALVRMKAKDDPAALGRFRRAALSSLRRRTG